MVINNRGGKIFSRIFPQREFQNEHAIDFSAWASMWKMGYERLVELPSAWHTTGPASGPAVIVTEIEPDEAASGTFWKEYERLCRAPSEPLLPPWFSRASLGLGAAVPGDGPGDGNVDRRIAPS